MLNDETVGLAALNLLRHKMLVQVQQNKFPSLDILDVNEVLLVAGLPLIVPDEVNAKEVQVIKTSKDDVPLDLGVGEIIF